MRRMNHCLLAAVLALAALGCEASNSPQQAQAPMVQPPMVKPPVIAPPAPAEAEPERVVAAPGVGAKGRDYGGGIITEPVRQYWRQQEVIQFNINFTRGMNEYKALNDGKGPATHEEFMEQIAKPYGIKLPQLPPGEKYVYDPEREELMVERPAKK